VYDVVVKKFTFAISSADELLVHTCHEIDENAKYVDRIVSDNVIFRRESRHVTSRTLMRSSSVRYKI